MCLLGLRGVQDIIFLKDENPPDKDEKDQHRHHDPHRVGDAYRQVQAFRRLEEVSHGHGGHERGRQGRDEACLGREAVFVEEYCTGPQHDHGQRLIGPGEVPP